MVTKDHEKVFINYMGKEIICDAVIASFIRSKNPETIRKENGKVVLDVPLEEGSDSEGIVFGYLDADHLLDISTSFLTHIWPMLDELSKQVFIEELTKLVRKDEIRIKREERKKHE